MNKAKQDAFHAMRALDTDNIDAEQNDFLQSEEIEFEKLDENFTKGVDSHGLIENSNSDLLIDFTVLSTVQGNLELRDYTDCKIKLNESSPFTIVTDSTGKETVVLKSSICWLLNEFSEKLSSDRQLRVRQSEYESYKSNEVKHFADFLEKCEQINIDDQAILTRINSNKFLIGLVFGFGYLGGTTRQTKEYSCSYANIEGNRRDIGVSCQWFGFTKRGHLSLINTFASF